MHIQFETLCEKWVASGIQYSGEKFRGYFFEMKRSKIQIIHSELINSTQKQEGCIPFCFPPTKSVINKIVGRRPIDPARETMLAVESFSSVRSAGSCSLERKSEEERKGGKPGVQGRGTEGVGTKLWKRPEPGSGNRGWGVLPFS